MAGDKCMRQNACFFFSIIPNRFFFFFFFLGGGGGGGGGGGDSNSKCANMIVIRSSRRAMSKPSFNLGFNEYNGFDLLSQSCKMSAIYFYLQQLLAIVI